MNNKQVNDIVFEALFRQVVIDSFNDENDSIPPNEQLTKAYLFFPKFEILMKKLFIKDRRESFAKSVKIYSSGSVTFNRTNLYLAWYNKIRRRFY